MPAVWMRSRAELRTRLGSVLVLALIVGVIGGVVIAAGAGARRTISAYPRFVKAENGLDVVVKATTGLKQYVPSLPTLTQEVQHLPEIKDQSLVVKLNGYLQIPGRKAPGNVFPILPLDGKLGFTVNRPKILAGRMVNPAATDELFPSFAVANQLGLKVGETVRLAYGGLLSNVQAGPNSPAPVTMHVVGIGAIPSMFQPLAGGYLPGVYVSAGFAKAHAQYIPAEERDIVTTLKGGLAAVPHFSEALQGINRGLPHPGKSVGITFTQASQTGGVQEATRAEAVALWILAALVAVAGLAIFAQALARQTFLESIEYPTLRSLGMTPSELFVVGMVRVVLIGIVGALVAAVVGYLLSPLTPTGIARIAEPHPGFALDGLVLGVGVAGVAVLTVLAGAIPVWRAASARWTAHGTAAPRGRRRGASTAIRSFPPSGRAGVRMALDPGAGRTAVPVRTAVFGAAVTMIALAAALSFGASLNRLETKPALSGRTWSMLVFAPGSATKPGSGANRLVASVDGNSDVSGYALGSVFSARVGDLGTVGEALDSRRGDVGPALIEGRLPTGPNEIALGTQTMSALHTHIGGTVPTGAEGGTVPMRVVGRVAFPPLFFSFTRPGEGVAMSLRTAQHIAPKQTTGGTGVFMRLAPGIGLDQFANGLQREFPGIFVVPQEQSAQLSSLNQIGQVPLILAGILALMAMTTLAHTLITSIRRRRQDLAVLKTLGFVRGQVSATVAWQATTLGALSLLIGIPIGIIAGRWGWNVFADHLGVVPEAVVPPWLILLIVPATILVANLLAVVPGRIASRLRPATVLRAE